MSISTVPRTPVRSVLLMVGAAAGLIALAGCSGGSSPAAPAANQSGGKPAASAVAAGPVPGGTHEFQGVLTVTGATSQSVKFTEPLENLPSCADLAQTGEQGTWSIPDPGSDTFDLGINATPYKGPGTYTAMSTFTNSTWLVADNQQWDPVSASVASVTVKSDGSGSASVTDLQNEYTPGPNVTSTETWTCS